MKNINLLKLKSLSDELELEFESQDWGIANANPRRFEEFLSFYFSREFSFYEKYELEELIIASFNEKLIDHQQVNEDAFIDFLSHVNYKGHLGYWASLYTSDADEFPVSEIIRKVTER